MRTCLSRLTTRAAFALLLGATALPVLAAPAASATTATTPAATTPVASATSAACPAPASAALAGFFDGVVPGSLKKDHVPGAVVSVVSGDRTVFAKGYGLADVARGVAFDPSRSLVRIASITKLFTWTAVMQQVEAGRLDLDADVNRYLKGFEIPATYAEPVTLRTLMNHTAGFEDQVVGTGARASADVPPLGEYLARHVPARIRPPGEVSAYSNYGAALAGHIVAEVTGEPYDRYVRRHLLDPLGMTHSTATEPVPAPLAPGLARSYDSDAAPPRPVPFVFDLMPPDGSISATAADMANFMIAHLNGGRSGDRAVLSPATVALMHQRSFTADPRLGGYAHGFMDRTFNGHRVLMHDGGWEGFSSVLMLVPDCRLGLFLSANATGGAGTLGLISAFFDRFTPPPATPESLQAPRSSFPLTSTPPRPGFYARTRHNESTIEKILVLLGSLRLTVAGDGTVHFEGKDWVPRNGGLYDRKGGVEHLASLAGPSGHRYVAVDRGSTYQLIPFWQTPLFNLPVLLVFAVTALGALAVPAAALRRRLSRRPVTVSATWRTARALAAGAAALGLAFLVLLAIQLFGDTGEFVYGAPAGFRALLLMPLVVLPMAGAAAVCTVVAWRSGGVAARVHQVTVLAGLSALAWFLWQWNLVGWQFP
ncbi:serine hydrolase domain-containing protein [Sphaerisporangium aureirubrum]|uniref:Serine hydrolase domain-containing protein n=1 Tax=Sphaerisporangium aureirubrum TaxID=1544736 RepID=A0ABW1NNN8_9ACTN